MNKIIFSHLSLLSSVLFASFFFPIQDAKAGFVAASDGFGGFKNVFEITDTVFAFGDMNKVADPGPFGFLSNPTARVYVVVNQSWSGGEVLIDVTNDNFNNVTGVFGSGFFSDVALWTAPLTAGLYDIVLDENKNGKFDPINDIVMDLNLAGEVLVVDPNAPPVPLPTSLLLLLSAVSTLFLTRCRRMKKTVFS